MSITFWVSFLFATPPQDACTARGVPLVEITEGSEIDKAKKSTTKIFESGAWTVRTAAGVERGCFDRKERRSIRRAVQRAPWQVTSSPIACFAYDPNFTDYRVRGELRFTERMCNGKQADAKTMRAIELIKQELADEVMPTPLPPPPPPVATCSAQGTPLFEIHRKSDLEQPASSTAIYANGAWTQNGKSGCLSKQTIEGFSDVIRQSPWDTTIKSMVCRAYSPTFTEYYVNGKREYTARMCGAESLDAKSLGAIKIIEDELKNL